MKIAIIANSTRIGADLFAKENLDNLANQYQLQYELYSVEPNKIDTLLQTIPLHNFNTIVAAGGDGTVRSIAQALVNQDVPMAILPLGTFNYFARELNYPNDLAEVLKIIKNKKTKKVDVASINDIVFINHVTIGFYTSILKLRQKYKGILKNYKFLKIIFTAVNFFKVIPIYHLTITKDGEELNYRTCMLFIGNNYHYTNFFDFGTRETLSGGRLSVYIFNCTKRWELFKCLMSMLFNTKNKYKYLTEFLTEKLTISSTGHSIRVDIDGELNQMAPPLQLEVLNKQLTVVVP